jgi:acetolactate synthase regulatory subunit
MTVAVRCDVRQCGLLCKQLMKIVDVVDVEVDADSQNELIANMNTGGDIDGDRVVRITR